MKLKRLAWIFLLLCFISCSKEEEKVLKRIQYKGNYSKDFNDRNDLHLLSASNIGISPVKNRDDIEKHKTNLVEVQATKNYEIKELTHSVPFLIPKASQLLDRIGENFSDSLQSLNAPHYKLIVTSITRTKQDVKQLQRTNGNSTKNSAHLYGTTFDISWANYVKADKSKNTLTDEQLKKTLASVLRDLHKQDACYIKYEKKQACFHITVR
jgi:uncharacterized protein YcbK (DUF882 family)